jgi:putative zinc finger protein
VGGDLTARHRRRVEEHLSSCPACTTELKATRDTRTQLGTLGKQTPSEETLEVLRANVLAALPDGNGSEAAPREVPDEPPNVEFTIHLVKGLGQATGDEEAPQALGSVVDQLADVFVYEAYDLVETAMLRMTPGRHGSVSGVLPSEISDVGMLEGQHVVVGKSNIDASDDALFMILSAKIVE